jgi:Uri superfamily endonuclease
MRTSPIRALYDRGRGIAAAVRRRVNGGADQQVALEAVAEHAGHGLKEVRLAFDFYRDVEAVAGVVPSARTLALSGRTPHLTPSLFVQLRRRSPAAVERAMARAAAGLHPFAPPPPPDLPADLAPWHFDLDRLRRATAELTTLEAAFTGQPQTLPDAVAADLAVHALAVRVAVAALGTLIPVGPPRVTANTTPGPIEPAALVKHARAARDLLHAVAGDLPRAAHAAPPPPTAAAELAAAVGAVAALVRRIERRLPPVTPAVPPPAVRMLADGPRPTGGTYVVLLDAPAAGVVRLGRHGTFRLPAGHLLYVGTAFGAGGVLSRTDRHVLGTGPRLWQLDDLRGFAAPAARWWTHHPSPLEHAWARAVANLPGCLGVAPGAGGTDCHTSGDCRVCPAHLFAFAEPPTPRAFARRLGLAGSGGYEIGVQTVSSGPNPADG